MLFPTNFDGTKAETSGCSPQTHGHSPGKLSRWIKHAKKFTIPSPGAAPTYNHPKSEVFIRRYMVYVGYDLLVGSIGSRTFLEDNCVEASHEYLGQPEVKPADLGNVDKLTHDLWKDSQEKFQKNKAMIIRFINQVVSGQVGKTYTSIKSRLGSEAAILRAITTADDTIHRLLAEGLVDAFVGMEAVTPLPTSIQIGFGTQIPRYKCGVTLQYYVDIESFQPYWSVCDHLRGSSIEDIAHAFDKGTCSWEKVPVKFFRVYNSAEAWFIISFSEDGGELDTLATAFFPNAPSHRRVLWVYSPALSEKFIRKLHLIFEHEIGHILGLRHENPLEEEARSLPSVTFGLPNPESVMLPIYGKRVSDQDVTECTEFYTHPGSEINNRPLNTVTPEYPTME